MASSLSKKIRPLTHEEQAGFPTDVIVPLEAPFVDPRGSIQPLVDHAMHFTEDTVFLTFGRNSRAQEVYEADVVRIESLLPSGPR